MNRRRRHDAAIATEQDNGADSWRLVWGQPYIDCKQLAAALERDLANQPAPDFRTRLLVRDAARALRSYWGTTRFDRWIASSSVGDRIGAILKEKLGRSGYRYLRKRLVNPIGRQQIEQLFELLGRGVHGRVEVTIAGSIPTLIEGLTRRPTDDIDLVNEVPPAIRDQRAVIDQIKTKFGLTLGHVQEHYLPTNWEKRRHYLGDFGGLRVYLADVYDVFVSKLSSKQEKHLDDLRVLAPQLEREVARKRLLKDGKAFLESPRDRATIEENWRFVFREPLFADDNKVAKKQAPKKSDQTKKRRKR